MADRLLPLTEWALMFCGVVLVAVILSVIDADSAKREERDDA